MGLALKLWNNVEHEWIHELAFNWLYIVFLCKDHNHKANTEVKVKVATI